MSEERDYPVADLAAILSLDDKKEDWVNIPEWEMKIKVKSLSKADQVRLRKQSMVKGPGGVTNIDPVKMEQLLIVYGVVEPKFTTEHIDRLFEKQSGAVDRILAAIFKISGMTEDSAKDAEADFQE